MPDPKKIIGKPNRISIKRCGRSISVMIEGTIALLVVGATAIVYLGYLFH